MASTTRLALLTLIALLLAPLAALHAADAVPDATVTVAPMVNVCERPGITGAGWAVAYDFGDGANTSRRVVNIYPNHPDDWGKSGGTGFSHSADDGQTWLAGPDNHPLPGMVDMWQDRLHNGELVTFGIRSVPDRQKALADPAGATGEYMVGISRDRGRTWAEAIARIHCPVEIGALARPLPRIFEDPQGTWFMPAYSWSRTGNRTLLLKSADRGRNWNVASTIATADAIRKCGVTIGAPWLETAVARTSDGSLLAVMRTGSNAQAALVTARSADNGLTWSAVEKLLAGPQRRIVPGKLPSLCLMPNGVLVLLTAHTRNHCRIYLSRDGIGRQWSDGYVITSQSGGNTSMVCLGSDKLLVFTPANGRICSWQVTVTTNNAPQKGRAASPTNVRVASSGAAVRIAWSAPAGAGEADHYLVAPVFIRPSEANKDTEVYRYASIRTRDAATQCDLGRTLSLGGTYRFEIVAVDREGRRSTAASSAEVVVGPKPGK